MVIAYVFDITGLLITKSGAESKSEAIGKCAIKIKAYLNNIRESTQKDQQCIYGKYFITLDKNFEVDYRKLNHNPLSYYYSISSDTQNSNTIFLDAYQCFRRDYLQPETFALITNRGDATVIDKAEHKMESLREQYAKTKKAKVEVVQPKQENEQQLYKRAPDNELVRRVARLDSGEDIQNLFIELLKECAFATRRKVSQVIILIFTNPLTGGIQFNQYVNNEFVKTLNIKEEVLGIKHFDFLLKEQKLKMAINYIQDSFREGFIQKYGSCKPEEVMILVYSKQDDPIVPLIEKHKRGHRENRTFVTWQELIELF